MQIFLLGIILFLGCGGDSQSTIDAGISSVDAQADANDPPDANTPPDAGVCSQGCLVDTWNLDNRDDTGLCGCEYECTKVSDDDSFDTAATDENCDGSDGIVSQCVFVSPSLGDSLAQGTPSDPVDTIAQGIVLAENSQRTTLCLSSEMYMENVVISSGIHLIGGHQHNHLEFPFRRSDSAVTSIVAEGTVLLAATIDLPTEIRALSVRATTSANVGASSYGLRLLGGIGELLVADSSISAENGQAGGPGTDGLEHKLSVAPGGNGGTGGCQGTNCGFGGAQTSCLAFGGRGGDGGYSSGSGQNGSPGTGNATVGIGSSGSSCFSGGTTPGGLGGTPSASGDPGDPGTQGGTASIVNGLYLSSPGENGEVGQNGFGGSGGGGGGGGDNAGGFCNSDKGGGGGSGGCGGLGGNAGSGGDGAGGSFAIFVVGGKLLVSNSTLSTGDGGNGGAGGIGGAPQLGGAGAIGGGGSDDSSAGGQGGAGTSGGSGGPGAGGNGGAAACLAFATGASIDWLSQQCTLGNGGSGGLGGTDALLRVGATGSDGNSTTVLELP